MQNFFRKAAQPSQNLRKRKNYPNYQNDQKRQNRKT